MKSRQPRRILKYLMSDVSFGKLFLVPLIMTKIEKFNSEIEMMGEATIG